MRVAVEHATRYRYRSEVTLGPHIFRLRPRDDGSQRVVSYEIEISPQPAGKAWILDAEGNTVLEAWFAAPVKELGVTSRFEVETLRENPFDFLLPPAAELALPLRYGEAMSAALAYYIARGQDGEIRRYAHETAQAAGGQAPNFLNTLAERMHGEFRQIVREVGPAYAPRATLEAGEGSCRDLAVLFCEVCRAVGLAARFVSGYEREAASQNPAYMHAWAEVAVPGGGWRGYDPSRGLATGAGHIPVAAAREAAQAAPISGAYHGAAEADMTAAMAMRVLPTI